jgi:hypothetical protein
MHEAHVNFDSNTAVVQVLGRERGTFRHGEQEPSGMFRYTEAAHPMTTSTPRTRWQRNAGTAPHWSKFLDNMYSISIEHLHGKLDIDRDVPRCYAAYGTIIEIREIGDIYGGECSSFGRVCNE